MNAIQSNQSMFSGETPIFKFSTTLEGTSPGTAVDLTSATISYVLRLSNAAGPLQFSKTAGAGIVIADQVAEKGVFRVTLNATDTKSLTPGPYYYEVRVTLAGVVLTVTYGVLTIQHSGA